MKIVTRMGAAFAMLSGLAVIASAESKLDVGMHAPEIKVAKWVKGSPVTEFEKGKVYVVEFWATWCGPCKQSIPHLTELAKKYSGKVTFTGVSIWEKNAPVGSYANYGDKVAAFVKDYGDKMNYNVAWDGDHGAMDENWMHAANRNGIPSAFIVDQNSMVVWMGHPMVGLDEALGQVVDGTFDVKAEAEKESKEKEDQDKRNAVFTNLSNLLKSSDFKGAVGAMDKMIAETPAMEMNLGVTRYRSLSHYDIAGSNAYAKKLEEGAYKGQAAMLNSLAWTMIGDPTPVKGADTKLAVKIAKDAVAATKDGTPDAAANEDTLAYAYFKNGQLADAIKVGQKALDLADATKGFDADTRKELADHLEKYKQKNP